MRRAIAPALVVPLMSALALPGGGRAAPRTVPSDTLTLADAVRRALELDPAVAEAEADRAAATAAVKVAGAARFPSLSSVAQGTRFEEPMVVAPIHAFDLSRAPSFDRTLVQGRAELAWTLWDGGARGARIEGARATDAAGRASVRSARQQSLGALLEAYLAVLTARD
ncbi:MAG TPA: TolC family protein, partial [Longimicrobiales bacterium]|nr:TolC family protein [Longimicrobiales bacterium]